VGDTGSIRVELSRPGLSILSDERVVRIVGKPPAREPQRRVTLPPFKVISVKDMDDQLWAELNWPDNPNLVASSAVMTDGELFVYYSEIFPNYKSRLTRLEAKDSGLGESFTARYKIWLAVDSLLFYQDQQEKQARATDHAEISETEQEMEDHEQNERRRIATISAIFAQRETQQSSAPSGGDE
jgi:hypothetical protein